MKTQRLLELDALRGLAALAVVCYHYFYRYNHIYSHEGLAVDWAQPGRYGVELFFMVSGFVIFWTLKRVEKPFDFVVSRFSRLYPAYWFALLVTFSLVCYFGLPGREVSWFDAFVNMFMVQGFVGVPHVDGVYWTLTVELLFYFWMFVLYLTSSLDRTEVIFLLVILLSVLHSLGIVQIPAPIYKVLIMKYLPFFMSGICFYKILNGTGNYRLTVFALFLSLFSTISIYSFKEFVIFVVFYAVFYMALSGRMKFLTFRPFVFMGSISYSLYLLHQNIGYIIMNKFYEFFWDPSMGILVSAVFVLTLATFSSKYIERPSLRYMRKSYRQSKKIQRVIGKLTFSNKN